MLDLSDRPDETSVEENRPLTRQDKTIGIVFVVTFLLWLPTYLFVVRPAINAVIFRFIGGYPAMIHIVPIFAVPYFLTMAYMRVAKPRK